MSRRSSDFPCSPSVLYPLRHYLIANPSVRLCWYAADKYLRDLKAKEEFSPRVLEGIEELASFLVSEVRAVEKGTEQAKKEAKDQIPAERVKDAPALARELRWRVRLAAGCSSDDEGLVRKEVKPLNGHIVNGFGNKRKRGDLDASDGDAMRFRNFKPKTWDSVADVTSESDKRLVKVSRPNGDQWTEQWTNWTEDPLGDGDDEAGVDRRRDVIVKVRKTGKGIERQRVERVVEEWSWNEGSPTLTPGEFSEDKVKMEVDTKGEGAVNDDMVVVENQ